MRGAGVSPVATGDQRPCLWTPRFFEKNRVKLLNIGMIFYDSVRCRRICAVRFSIHASHCCSERAKGPSAPPGGWCMGYGFAGICRSSSPRTARRHTQVPPYNPVRTAHMVRRAGPMCPAADTHRSKYFSQKHLQGMVSKIGYHPLFSAKRGLSPSVRQIFLSSFRHLAQTFLPL